jgi:hypothetical protein
MAKDDCILTATIGHATFAAYAASDPYVMRLGRNEHGMAYIGIGHITCSTDGGSLIPSRRKGPNGWFVSKWREDELTLDLSDLSSAEVDEFAAVFGIPRTREEGLDEHPFWGSDAGLALARWTQLNPAKARRLAMRTNYLRNWRRLFAQPHHGTLRT